MAVPITVPRLDWSMDEGTFVEWLKGDGDAIRPGDALFVLESDKAAVNVEALDPGILRLGPGSPKPGDKVKVGQVLAQLVEEGVGEPPLSGGGVGEAPPSGGEAAPTTDRSPPPDGGGSPAPPPAPEFASPHRHAVSPRARRVARQLGIDCAALQGSGRNGRVRERDVRTAATTAAEGRLIPHTSARRAIAARMHAGVTQTAPVTLTTRVDATNLVNLRSQFQVAAGPDEVPGYTDLVVKLTAAELRQQPLLQAQWRDEGLFVPDRIDIAVAVDTDAGLLAPVLRGVDRLTLRQVAAQVRDLIDRARTGRLSADQVGGATFTVTNLGMFGVDAFTPIITLPQCAVLGMGRIVREPAVIEDRIVPRDQLTLSLTFDHRVVDGAPAARFLDALRRSIENPARG